MLSVPWRFDSEPDAARFFQGLFGLETTTDEGLGAMHDYHRLYTQDGKTMIEWKLIYCIGRR